MAVVTATMSGNWTGPGAFLLKEDGSFRLKQDGSKRSMEGSPIEFAKATAAVTDTTVTATMLGSWGPFTATASAVVEVPATAVGAWLGWDAEMVANVNGAPAPALPVTMLGDWTVGFVDWNMQRQDKRRPPNHGRASALEDYTKDRKLLDPLDWYRRHQGQGV